MKKMAVLNTCKTSTFVENIILGNFRGIIVTNVDVLHRLLRHLDTFLMKVFVSTTCEKCC